uniref:Hexosyltransferase n=1 Tax=Zooxanthella nutricula TaxID=1333877 RepID=A0A7S2J6M9_9DINO
MCQGVPQCNYFTWVADAGLEGCKSQCWLKGGNMSYKQAKRGLVSGVSPPRPPLPARLATRTSAPPSGNERSLFCFSLMVPHSYEKGLLSWQQERSTSIFGCDAWAVYSNVSIVVAPGVVTHVVQTDLSVKFGGDSYTALNSWIFIAVWKKVIDERWHKSHKWLVKVDPDAVFFPERLRPVVRAHEGVGYINNCKYGLHGPIEVLSAQALSTLEADYNASFDGKAPKECVERLHFGQWGEDFFLSRCLWKIHQVSRVTVPGLMCEAHCDCPDWYWCNDAERVTFHPFKRVDMYSQCMANSMAAPGAAAAPAAAHMVAQ